MARVPILTRRRTLALRPKRSSTRRISLFLPSRRTTRAEAGPVRSMREGAIGDAVDLKALAKAGEEIVAEGSVGHDLVFFLDAAGGMDEDGGELAVVRKEKKARGPLIEAPDIIDASRPPR